MSKEAHNNSLYQTPLEKDEILWGEIQGPKGIKTEILSDIDDWVQRIASNSQIKNTGDDIANKKDVEGKNTDTIHDAFGPIIKDGIPMWSSGNRMDCLIHSFLICVSDSFKVLKSDKRDTVASLFRRMLLPTLSQFQQYINELESSNVLGTVIADKLAKQFNINIIIISNGYQPGNRMMEVFTPFAGSNNMIVISNKGYHYTPVIYGGEYVKSITPEQLQEIKQIAERITKDAQEDLDRYYESINAIWQPRIEELQTNYEQSLIKLKSQTNANTNQERFGLLRDITSQFNGIYKDMSDNYVPRVILDNISRLWIARLRNIQNNNIPKTKSALNAASPVNATTATQIAEMESLFKASGETINQDISKGLAEIEAVYATQQQYTSNTPGKNTTIQEKLQPMFVKKTKNSTLSTQQVNSIAAAAIGVARTSVNQPVIQPTIQPVNQPKNKKIVPRVFPRIEATAQLGNTQPTAYRVNVTARGGYRRSKRSTKKTKRSRKTVKRHIKK
jgi:hypothetical protein